MRSAKARRIRPLLLLLLWVWALLVFVAVDLFLNVPELDRVRPEGRMYRATRYAAHRLVGEKYTETDEFARREEPFENLPLANAHREVRIALARDDWRGALTVAKARGISEIHQRGLGSRIGAALRENSRRRPPRGTRDHDWWFEREALMALILRVRPEEEFANAMGKAAELLADTRDKETVEDCATLLVAGLANDDPVLSGEEAFAAVAPELLPLIESGVEDYRTHRAGFALAALSTPQATEAILRGLESGVFHFPGALQRIYDPESASLLADALICARDFHLAGLVAQALLQCGEAGVDELRRVLSAADAPAGHILGACLTGLASHTRDLKDLHLIERYVGTYPGLRTAVNQAVGASGFDEERALAFVEYVSGTRDSLHLGITTALARWPSGQAERYVRLVRAKNPSAFEAIVAARKRIEEETQRVAALHKRRH